MTPRASFRHVSTHLGRVLGVVVVVGVAAAAVNVLWDDGLYSALDALGVALAVAATVPALGARRHPVGALLITCCAVLLLTWLDYSRWVAVIGPSLVLVGVLADRTYGFIAGALAVVVAVTLLALREEPYIDGFPLATLILVGMALLLGLLLRAARGHGADRSSRPARVA